MTPMSRERLILSKLLSCIRIAAVAGGMFGWGASAALCQCASEPEAKSQPGNAIQLTFENRTREALSIYWLDFAGTRKLYSTLGPGEQFRVSTFDSHPWVVANASGKCIALFRSEVDRVYPITEALLSSFSNTSNSQKGFDARPSGPSRQEPSDTLVEQRNEKRECLADCGKRYDRCANIANDVFDTRMAPFRNMDNLSRDYRDELRARGQDRSESLAQCNSYLNECKTDCE